MWFLFLKGIFIVVVVFPCLFLCFFFFPGVGEVGFGVGVFSFSPSSYFCVFNPLWALVSSMGRFSGSGSRRQKGR